MYQSLFEDKKWVKKAFFSDIWCQAVGLSNSLLFYSENKMMYQDARPPVHFRKGNFNITDLLQFLIARHII